MYNLEARNLTPDCGYNEEGNSSKICEDICKVLLTNISGTTSSPYFVFGRIYVSEYGG